MKKILLLSVFYCHAIIASPTGEKIVQGEIEVVRKNKDTLIFHKGEKGIIEWESFSIEEGHRALFYQSQKDSALLNRVTGDSPSKIEGELLGTGKIYLLNSNGILIGKNASINTGSFIASALNITNETFMQDRDLDFSGSQDSFIKNEGSIHCQGDIFLLASTVENEGTITSKEGQVNLIGSTALIMKKDDHHVFIEPKGYGKVVNKGYIEAIQVELQAQGENPYALAVNHAGIIDATTICKKNGKVYLNAPNSSVIVEGVIKAGATITVLGEDVQIKSGSILDANGEEKAGEIIIGGDYQGKNLQIKNASRLTVEKDVSIQANGLNNGDGGKVILWANDENHFLGHISAEGGKESGNGGFVEVSCLKNLDFKGDVSTLAYNGKTGELLLDPSNISIGSYGVSSPAFPTSEPGTYDPLEGTAYLSYLDVQSSLASNNVTITTSSGTGGSGIISFQEYTEISWSAPTTLSLQADCNIILSSGVSLTSTGTGTFVAMDFEANKSLTSTTGAFTGLFSQSATLSSAEGAIHLKATGGTAKHNVGVQLSYGSKVISTGTGGSAGSITIEGSGGDVGSYSKGVCLSDGSSVTSIDGDIAITGIAAGTEYYNYGVSIEGNCLVETTGSGSITLDGTSSTGLDANIGLNITTLANVIASEGNIYLFGTTSAVGNYNYGICIKEQAVVQSTNTAQIHAIGTSNGLLANNVGIAIPGGKITSTFGDVVLTATSNGMGNYNSGISMTSFGEISSTATGALAANITIVTNSGTGVTNNHGMLLNSNCVLTSIDGDIDVTATSRGSGDYNNGINLDFMSGISSTGTGANAANVTLTTQGGGGSYQVEGVYGQNESYVTTVDGTLTVTGGMVINE